MNNEFIDAAVEELNPVEICLFCGSLTVTEWSLTAGHNITTECNDCFIKGCHEVVRSEVIDPKDENCPF